MKFYIASQLANASIAIQITINGGDFRSAASVTLNNYETAVIENGIFSGIINQMQGVINGGDFYNVQMESGDYIQGGIYHSGNILANSIITGGRFLEDTVVINTGQVYDGIFDGTFDNRLEAYNAAYNGKIIHSGTVLAGDFSGLQAILSFNGSNSFYRKKGLGESDILGFPKIILGN